MRKLIIFLMSIGILVSWHICQSDLANAWNKRHRCSIAGMWKVTSERAGVESESWAFFTPIDPMGKRFFVRAGSIDYFDATFGGFYPDTKSDETFGYAERISPGLYEFVLYTYARNDERNVWKVVDRAELKMIDCDAVILRAAAEVLEWDDVNLIWVEPFFPSCNTNTSTLERTELPPACGEFPPWPESDGSDD